MITAYSIANVIIVPMTSWLSQQFGRRNYFVASIIIFTVSSFHCGNSTGIVELILFRFIQGLGGGALLVTSQTIITESYPPEKRAMAQSIYVLGVIIGPTLGPPLGGYVVDNFSWPYIFYQYSGRHPEEVITHEAEERKDMLKSDLQDIHPDYFEPVFENVIMAIDNFTAAEGIDMLIMIPSRHGLWYNIFQWSHTRGLVYLNHVPILSLHREGEFLE